MSASEITGAGPITWDEGGTADVLRAKDIEVTVRSTVPFPPGKPAGGTLAATAALPFTLKVARSQRVAEGVWDVRGRLLTATNEVRRAFESAARTPT